MPLRCLLLSLLVSCAPARAVGPPASVLHVDAGAPPGGDGSVHRPLRRLEEALGQAGARTVRLGPGRYAGPFRVPAGATLEGPPTAVLVAEGGGPLLTAGGALTLRGLTLRGGEVAVAGPGPWTLEEVVVTGQQGACLRREGGVLRVRGGRLEAGAGLAHCLLVGGGARVQLAGVALVGPAGRGVEVREGASLEAEAVRVEGAAAGLHQRGGRVRLRGAEVAGGTGPALYVAGGELWLEGVQVRGHEYGLLTGRGARVEARGLTSRGARRAGVALVQTQARLEGLRVEDSGDLAGVQLVGGEVVLRDWQVREARGLGVSVLQGQVTLERGEVSGVHGAQDEGDGLSVRRARVTVRDVAVRRADGVGLLVAEGAELSAEEVSVEGAGAAGAVAETQGRLSAGRLTVRGTTAGPALVAMERGQVRIERLVARGNAGGAVQAACEEGARVEVGTVEGDSRAGLEAPCVRAGGGPRAPAR